MRTELSIALCQIAPVVGDIEGNIERIRTAYMSAQDAGADLAVFCELVVSGYPPEDLVQKPSFQRACREAVERLAGETAGGPAMIISAPWRETQAQAPQELFNAAFLLKDGSIAARRDKIRLPNYGVFDEPRRFTPGTDVEVTDFDGIKLGLLTCEDLWVPGTGEALAAQGAGLLIAPHGSPFRKTAKKEREFAAAERARATNLPVIFVNQLAGQDEVVFDGASFVMDAHGTISYRCAEFAPGVFMTRWQSTEGHWTCTDGPTAHWCEGEELVYRAVTMGVRDYVEKNHFKGVVIGLSGGVDSALTAAIAVDALGAERVRCVMMPSRYTGSESLEDASACAAALGVHLDEVSIEPGVAAMDTMLGPLFEGHARDTTEENIQSRLRGMTLMAISNKFGPMVLTTGNKSEMSVGYATLYGDMNGGYNPLKDIYKTEVFALCRWRNMAHHNSLLGPAGQVIPERIVTKPPSAELREDQRDDDSLPPYEVLDDILECLVEREMPVREIIARGHDEGVVRRVEHLLYVAEYKRRQAPPGPKVTKVNFGRDRRYPITNGWRDRG
ncbi:MAG: NAD+ synthase [Pseudomonadota bacterium]